MTDALILNALKKGTPAKPKVKHLKSFHAKEQSDGKGYHVVRSSGKPNDPAQENTVADMDAVHQALSDHMGEEPAEGEQDAQAVGEGQPAMGGETA